MALPDGFVDLATAYKEPPGNFVSIIGVVVDIMQPVRSAKTGHWMFTFKLLDRRLQDSVNGSEGLIVRFFKDSESNLPQVRERGDVVLLRSAKLMPVNGVPTVVSNYQTRTQVFPVASIPGPGYSIAYQGTNLLHSLGAPADTEGLTLAAQAYVIQLKTEVRLPDAKTLPEAVGKKREAAPVGNAGPPEKKARHSTFGNKYQLVRETHHRKYADLCVQVVKKYFSQSGKCELYVTDYTENRDVWYYAPPEERNGEERDGDDFGHLANKAWPGPYGWLVLKINVMDPHRQFVNNKVDEGDLVLLKNVKMKIMAEGAKLEGDIWRDPDNPSKINVLKLLRQEIPEIQELLARKEKYWAKRNLQHPPAADESAKPTKGEKKRLKKQKQQEERAKAAADAARVAERNKHVRCSNEEASLMSVKDILDLDNDRHIHTLPNGTTYVLPFVNTQYRTKVHVVDFRPKAVEDFAVPPVPPIPDRDATPSPIDSVSWDDSQKYEWYFSLCLEDPSSSATRQALPAPDTAEKPRIWVHVRHKDAQFLFGNDMDDPQNLRTNPQILAKLKEKMCILWGNLEERREGEEVAVSNRPFECCVQEYGIKLDEDDPERGEVPFGYKKLFRMFGATIL
ncbi:hypothetical protein LTR02_007308 [Friedmanniomyces endolithicus]|nr:hypothetical protein LTR02_007308 [Friedmanniomyces endolithicus]